MAHHKAAHSHDIDMQKDFQVLRPERATSGDKTHMPKTLTSQVESDKVGGSVADEPQGFQIFGFPWLFVFNMGVIALGVLGMVLKFLGVF